MTGYVQEDLELLAFSSEEMIQSQKQVFAVHGLPLKAVYRDAVVGIRYLHPRVVPPGASPVRRATKSYINIAHILTYLRS